jgi:thiamine biosynthesis lipoprotein
VLDVVGISNVGLASSGEYRNYFEVDGQRYSHVIDPTTGRPITHKTASATVIAENAMLADAWATAMLILGHDRGLEIAEAQDLAVLFVERDADATDLRFKMKTSSRFKALTT